MNYNKYSACLLSLISIFFGFYKVNAGHFHSKTKKNTGSSPIMKDLDDINGPIINDNNSSLIKEWTAANNFHCRLYENGHLIVEATMPNSTIVNIFENHANLKNKVKTVLLLGDIISIESFYETKKVNKYFELIFPRGAFEGCENLTFFIIPKSVKNISRYAFSECKNLKSCNFKGKTFTLKKK